MNKFYNWINKTINVLISAFLLLALLSSLYLPAYIANNTYIFVVLVALLVVFYSVFRRKTKSIINKATTNINKYSNKQLLLFIVITLCLLKTVYSLIFYFDPTMSNDVISIYANLVNDFINNGILNKTIGDSLYALTIHLSSFKVLNIPYHIGTFIIISVSIVLNYLTFNQIIGKEKAFIVSLLYSIMPSTILLSFCPTIEVYVLLYISLYLFVLTRLFETDNKILKMIYAVLLVIIVFALRCFGFIGYILLVITFAQLLLSDIKASTRYVLTGTLVLSILVINIFDGGLSYTWRNDEYLYQSMLNGSNLESYGRFVEGYTHNEVEEYLNANSLEGSHENQKEAYISSIKDNYSVLINEPKNLTELLVNKYFVSWSGNHYSIEMLQNNKDISNFVYYVLLSFGEIIYVFVLLIGLMSNHSSNNLSIKTSELILIFVSIVLLIGESQNKYSLFMTPLIYVICLSRSKE